MREKIAAFFKGWLCCQIILAMFHAFGWVQISGPWPHLVILAVLAAVLWLLVFPAAWLVLWLLRKFQILLSFRQWMFVGMVFAFFLTEILRPFIPKELVFPPVARYFFGHLEAIVYWTFFIRPRIRYIVMLLK